MGSKIRMGSETGMGSRGRKERPQGSVKPEAARDARDRGKASYGAMFKSLPSSNKTCITLRIR